MIYVFVPERMYVFVQCWFGIFGRGRGAEANQAFWDRIGLPEHADRTFAARSA